MEGISCGDANAVGRSKWRPGSLERTGISGRTGEANAGIGTAGSRRRCPGDNAPVLKPGRCSGFLDEPNRIASDRCGNNAATLVKLVQERIPGQFRLDQLRISLRRG